jgi:hydroxymethylbilane synthase
VRVRLISRSSALAVLQAALVERALRERWPSLAVERSTWSSEGDRDRTVDLSASASKGLFTADLSQALLDADADAVIHSWKDLPIAGRPETRIAATLERADPRDVLLVRRESVDRRPTRLAVLSSSPRRAWQIQTVGPRLLPWKVSELQVAAVRGNIPTRLRKLIGGEADALVVAKAALDRLLSCEAPAATKEAVRSAIDACRWMVLPISECPTAPAQGALAVEIAAARADLAGYFEAITHQPTWAAVQEERRILESFGGGCAEAIGATVLSRAYGRVTSVRANIRDRKTEVWELDAVAPLPPPTTSDRLWPRPDERHQAERHALAADPPAETSIWVARAEALPSNWPVTADWTVWSAGVRTWQRLADRGIWVNGCADGLGDNEAPDVDALAGRSVRWHRLSHDQSGDPDAIPTYAVRQDLPGDLAGRSHFYWTSGSVFRRALVAHPGIRAAWHASGPGRTASTIREALGETPRQSIWLDYERWHHHVTS